jgi:hypothetical protein
MELSITKEQYRSLAKMVYLGNWLINSVRTDEEQIEEFDTLEQYIYSFAEQAGMGKVISLDPALGRFITNWEDGEHPDIDRYIDEYNEENFWHELVHRLAERDFIRAYGERTVKDMSMTEHIEKQDEFVNRYADEFEKNAIENLTLVAEKAVAGTK